MSIDSVSPTLHGNGWLISAVRGGTGIELAVGVKGAKYAPPLVAPMSAVREHDQGIRPLTTIE